MTSLNCPGVTGDQILISMVQITCTSLSCKQMNGTIITSYYEKHCV